VRTLESAGHLVQVAADGNEQAWQELVDRYTGLLWSVARAYGLPAADAADVVQTAWLRLVERLGSLREPDRVAAWLATTVRHECLRTLRRAGRQVLADDDRPFEVLDPGPSPDARLITSERDAALWRSIDQLPERCRRLLRVLMSDPPPNYEDVSAALDMPVGSIGPTRRRCLEQLRRAVELAGVRADAGGMG
jgi:RNA polymerase sigma factor (sigma-70 family)